MPKASVRCLKVSCVVLLARLCVQCLKSSKPPDYGDPAAGVTGARPVASSLCGQLLVHSLVSVLRHLLVIQISDYCHRFLCISRVSVTHFSTARLDTGNERGDGGAGRGSQLHLIKHPWGDKPRVTHGHGGLTLQKHWSTDIC